MKHRIQNIRHIIRPPQHPQAEREQSDNPLNQLVSLLKNFIQTKPQNKAKVQIKPYSSNPRNHYEVQARDRQVYIELPQFVDNKLPQKGLKLWISDVFNTVCSSAFNYFSKNQMSYEQAKIYCSQNIFKNIVLLSQKYILDKKQMEMIDNHIKKGVLNYLAAKYPPSESTQINKKLQAVVKEVDNIESLQNNYFTNSKIVFEYRESENYNDLIMQMLNDLMGSIDQLSMEQTTNYQQFESFMSQIFQKVTDQQWMKRQSINRMLSQESMRQTIRRISEDKEKYKIKVKEYTNYAIGRKINQNTPQFTAREIQTGNISIKSPQILRILTKWCKQLQQKCRNGYFSNRSQSVKLQRGQTESSLLSWMRGNIDMNLQIQNKYLREQMNELLANNYQMQASLLQSQMRKQGGEHVSFSQKVCGKFSYNVVKNLHTYIIAYLNKLIHRILMVSKEFVEFNFGTSSPHWPSPPNLLSFQISDLMRCKFASKQRQVLKIYEEINRISRQNPQKLKIVRIKNRLRLGTNDILLNVRFNDKILCEIQLAIINKTSDFIKCSNSFNHYIYQLQRSLFGPLTELCSIWNSLDRRTNIYEQLVEQEQNKQSKEHQCIKLNKIFQMKPYEKPFICSKCQHVYTHSQYIKDHIKCNNCNYVLCAKCIIDGQSQQNLKKIFGKDKIKFYCGKRVLKVDKLPRYGICALIESQSPKAQLFTLIKYRSNDYLLGKIGEQFYEICSVRTQKEKEIFFKKYLIFQIIPNNTFLQINEKDAKSKYIIPLLIKNNFSKEKESINLMDLQLSSEGCHEILSLGTKAQRENVKNLYLADNQIQKLPVNPKQFPNIRWITLGRNKNIKDLNGIQELTNLRNLSLIGCNLTNIPSPIFDCPNIEILSLQFNLIHQIDNKIANLKELTTVQLTSNKIKQLPQGLFQCRKLKKLNFQNNLLTQIPQSINKLQALQELVLSSNQITILPESIGSLQKLKKILLNSNKQLISIPASFQSLKLLQFFDISQTGIDDIPINQEGWIHLKHFIVNNSKVKCFNIPFKKTKSIQVYNVFCLENVSIENLIFNNCKYVNISYNSLKTLPNFSKCQSLILLNISYNKLQTIPSEYLQNVVQLEQFDCRSNLLTSLPNSLAKMKRLKKLEVSSNLLKQFFQADFEETLQFGKPLWPDIRQLKLESNKLVDIPLCLCFHPKIKKIKLQTNLLKRIRPQIKYMVYLQQFNASTNDIEQIPKEMSQLIRLQVLLLKDNKIKHVPNVFKNLHNFFKFQIDGCPIETIEDPDFWLYWGRSSLMSKWSRQIKEKQGNKTNK